jgi:hypothetical protein
MAYYISFVLFLKNKIELFITKCLWLCVRLHEPKQAQKGKKRNQQKSQVWQSVVVLGRFAKNRKIARPILLLPRERLESIRTRFPVERFAKTAKKHSHKTNEEHTFFFFFMSLSNASGSEEQSKSRIFFFGIL